MERRETSQLSVRAEELHLEPFAPFLESESSDPFDPVSGRRSAGDVPPGRCSSFSKQKTDHMFQLKSLCMATNSSDCSCSYLTKFLNEFRR